MTDLKNFLNSISDSDLSINKHRNPHDEDEWCVTLVNKSGKEVTFIFSNIDGGFLRMC